MSNSAHKTHLTEAELDKIATTMFHADDECSALCDDLQTTENELEALEAAGASSAQKAQLVARMRAITTQRKHLNCKFPCHLQ